MAARSLIPTVFTRFPRAFDDWFPAMPDMDRMLDEVARGRSIWSGADTAMLAPRIDVSETDGELHITVELAGVDPGDVEISLLENVLRIKGEKKEEKNRDEKNVHVAERRYGMFMRQLPLRFEPSADSIHASFDKGVLSIAIAKPAAPRPVERKIAISRPGKETAVPQ
jgi:HSP20 family protein